MDGQFSGQKVTPLQGNNDHVPTAKGRGTHSISGRIANVFDRGIENVRVELDSAFLTIAIDTTDSDGFYSFTNLPGSDYIITPVKSDHPKNGVSTLDLIRIQQHLLGQTPFTRPDQYIAADINGSWNVSAIDLIELRKLILGIYPDFPNNSSWRFFPKGFMFPAMLDPWPFPEYVMIPTFQDTAVDFIGIKIGDINGTALPGFHQLVPRTQ
jgi:hypothetical protein